MPSLTTTERREVGSLQGCGDAGRIGSLQGCATAGRINDPAATHDDASIGFRLWMLIRISLVGEFLNLKSMKCFL